MQRNGGIFETKICYSRPGECFCSKSLNQLTDQELTACIRGIRVGRQAEEARQKPMDVQSPSLAGSALTKIWEVSNCNSLG
jgi:hypothetical protein